jgi:hypothetical protein
MKFVDIYGLFLRSYFFLMKLMEFYLSIQLEVSLGLTDTNFILNCLTNFDVVSRYV